MLSEPIGSTLVVENRDRLARFAVEHLQAALLAQLLQQVAAEL